MYLINAIMSSHKRQVGFNHVFTNLSGSLVELVGLYF